MHAAQIVQLAAIFTLMATAIFYFFTKNLVSFKRIHLWVFSLLLLISVYSLLTALNIFTYKLLVEKRALTVIALFSLLIIPVISMIAYYNIADIKLFIKKLKD